MRHKRLAKKFGRSPEHRAQLMRMLCAALIIHDRIETTLKKAKQARKDAEKLVTLARKGTLAARRRSSSPSPARAPSPPAASPPPASAAPRPSSASSTPSSPPWPAATAVTPASPRSAPAAATPPRCASSNGSPPPPPPPPRPPRKPPPPSKPGPKPKSPRLPSGAFFVLTHLLPKKSAFFFKKASQKGALPKESLRRRPLSPLFLKNRPSFLRRVSRKRRDAPCLGQTVPSSRMSR